MSARAEAVALAVAALVATLQGCGPRSIVIGGDPDGRSGDSGDDFVAGGTSSAGGIPSTGGFAVGGGGASGGVSTSVGGTSAGGRGGTGGNGAEGGEFDPYPPVAWEDGQGYRRSCPNYDEMWGFSCWNFDRSGSHSCGLDLTPYCNACSCAVPCDTGADCPSSVTGHPADCLSSPNTARSCFVVCDDGNCPTGMACAPYPGGNRNVCMWLSDPPSVGPR